MSEVAAPTRVRAFRVPGVATVATQGPKEGGELSPGAGSGDKVATVATLRGLAHDFEPSTEAEMAQCLADPEWRLFSGRLYKIMVKSAVDGETVVPFRPNRAQRRFIARLWHRNVILKARQLGFTTLVAIMWLDHALFNANQRCVMVAQDRETAEAIFRDKVKLAYDRLPEAVRAAVTLQTENKSELLFSNNSSIKVSTSARGGTPHRLHISEFGKIGAADPAKAREVVTGSFPAVPADGITIVESTAEGQDGEFYDLTQRAMAVAQERRILTEKDFRFHFYPWWQEPGYRIVSSAVPITEKDREYFAQIEALTGTTLDPQQRNWYVATKDSEFSGDPEKMWQEYPSTPQEAFQVSTEGVYYATQLAEARKHGRITRVPHVMGVPVNTFWDIGNTDGTAIWLHQRVGFDNRFIGFIEGWNEPYDHYVSQLQAKKYVWGTHYLPHDAKHKRQMGKKVASPEDELRDLDIGGEWEIVPAVDQVIHGIQATRKAFSTYWFDAEACAPGIVHLTNYRKTWNRARGGWNVNTPCKVDGHSEAADALRQHGQGYVAPSRTPPPPPASGNWRTA